MRNQTEVKHFEVEMESIGKNIETLMRKNGIRTLKELSNLCDIPVATLHHLKNGRPSKDISCFTKLAQALNTSLYFLLYGKEDPFYTKQEEILKNLFNKPMTVQINVLTKEQK